MRITAVSVFIAYFDLVQGNPKYRKPPLKPSDSVQMDYVATEVRHPRRAGGLMSWAASGGRAVGLGRALRVSFHASELSATIRGILLADVLAHLLQFEPYRGNRVAASPEVFAGEVPLLAR